MKQEIHDVVLEAARSLIAGSGSASKVMILEHLDECPECLRSVAQIWALNKMIAESDTKQTEGHPSEFDLMCFLEGGGDSVLSKTIRLHLEKCEACVQSLESITRELEKMLEKFKQDPERRLSDC